MLSELLSELRYRLRALVHRGAMERELDDELRFHLERETEKLVAMGVNTAEARRRARIAFGGVDRFKDEARHQRGISPLETFVSDLRYAARGLRARPGFALAVVLTLGLGLGANAATFGLVDRLLFRPPPFLVAPERTHRIYVSFFYDGQDNPTPNTEYTRYLDLRRWTTSFERWSAFHNDDIAVGEGEDAREMRVGIVNASFWSFFDASPALGRFFDATEDSLPRGAPVVVLSNAFWQSRYGARRDVLGKALQVGSIKCTIIGVAPDGFVGVGDDNPPVVYIPTTTYASHASHLSDVDDYYRTYHWGWTEMMARRKPGVSVAAASADLSNALRRSAVAESTLSATAPIASLKPHAIAAPISAERGPTQSNVTKVATWTSGVALIVLLIACANVANLLLARAIGRRREVALRLALGVTRSRLISQLATESLLLAVLGGVAGLIAGYWGNAALRALFLPDGAPEGLAHPHTMLAVGGATLLAGVLTGLAPMLQSVRGDAASTLKSGAREGTYQRSRLRTLLLVLQGALCVVLLVGAGLFVRSLHNVRAMRLGYDVDPVLYVSTNMRGVKVTDDERAALARRLHDVAASIPGVASATRAATVPFWNSWSQGFSVPGIDSVRRLGRFTLQSASSEYFRTMGTRVLRGRGIEESDRKGAPGVVIVSESMAKVLWPGKDAIGQCMKMGSDTMPCSRVVGIAEDIKQNSLTQEKAYQYYMPIEQFHPEAADLFVRVTGKAEDMSTVLRRRLQPLLPGVAYLTVTPMHDIVDPRFKSWTLGASMFLTFGALALALAAIGLYAVIAYTVAQRTHELGVRVALGAGSGDVVKLVVGQGVRFAVAGVAIGSLVALAAARWVEPLLFAQSARDPLVFGAVGATVLAVATLASLMPALRASRVDPARALRAE